MLARKLCSSYAEIVFKIPEFVRTEFHRILSSFITDSRYGNMQLGKFKNISIFKIVSLTQLYLLFITWQLSKKRNWNKTWVLQKHQKKFFHHFFYFWVFEHNLNYFIFCSRVELTAILWSLIHLWWEFLKCLKQKKSFLVMEICFWTFFLWLFKLNKSFVCCWKFPHFPVFAQIIFTASQLLVIECCFDNPTEFIE